MPGARDLAECKAACKSAAASGLPFCEGVVWERREGKCYRKTRIIVGLCEFDTAFDLHLRSAPPPPNLPAPLVVARLNERFAQGRPSATFADAGVVMNAFDQYDRLMDDAHAPWSATGSSRPGWGDRWSVSVTNAATPFFYMGNDGSQLGAIDASAGMVLAPGPAQEAILCSYTTDVGTSRFMCDPPGVSPTCTPGCPDWIDRNSDGYRGKAGLEGMLRHHLERRGDCAPRERAARGLGPCCDCCTWPKCQLYNEIILEGKACEAALPTIVEAFFFVSDTTEAVARLAAADRSRPSGEALAFWARRLFQKQFNITLPIVGVDLSRPAGPFFDGDSRWDVPPPPPPIHHTGRLSSSMCSDLIRDPKHKFSGLWGTGWDYWADRKYRWPGQRACWQLETTNWWDWVATGPKCQQDWGNNLDAPTVFGFARSMTRFCDQRGGSGGDPGSACRSAGFNILRIGKWDMCRNTEWMICVVLGEACQAGRRCETEIIFTEAPGELSIDEFNSREGYFTEDDVYYLEVCLLNEMCSNHDDIFTTRDGGSFFCQFDAGRWRRAARDIEHHLK